MDVREHKDGGETFPSGGGEDFKGGATSKTQLIEQAGGDGHTVLKSLMLKGSSPCLLPLSVDGRHGEQR